MLDLKLIRKEAKAVEEKLQKKDPTLSLSSLIALDTEHRALLQKTEELKMRRNALSKEIGEKVRNKEPVEALKQEVASFGETLKTLEAETKQAEEKLTYELSCLPNLPCDDVLVSHDPDENQVLRTWKEKPLFSFPPKNHLELAESLGLLDMKRGAKVTGSGWPIYKGLGARLEWALLQYMYGFHIKKGLTPVMVPHLVKEKTMFGAAQLPKFASQLFQLQDSDYPLYLVPTAEAALMGLHMDEILSIDELPLRYCSYTPCFRREAGAAGEKERGLIRVHQFNKVEMFAYTTPEESWNVFEQMVRSAEEILESLGLHYRSMLLVTGDMSFPSAKTIDIEAYLPGQERYYEVSSVSNCTDYQARRSNCRFKREAEGATEFVHTLNGSGLATSRLMVSLLETYQTEEGHVIVPEVLRPYLEGVEKITP